MNVTVAFTTQLKAALGKSEQIVSLSENASAFDAIAAIGKQHPDVVSQFVMTDGVLLPSILLSVNDQQVASDATLTDGDVLTLLSAISGG